MLFVTAAYAQATGAATAVPGAAPGLLDPAGPLGSLFMFVPIIAIFWLLIIRPQQKRARETKAMLSAVRRGDTIVSTGGIVGKVTKAVDGEDLEVEIAPSVKIKLVRGMIADVRSKAEPVNDNKPA